MRQSGYAKSGTVDRHIVDSAKSQEGGGGGSGGGGGGGGGSHELHTRHSWRGFQYVIVRTSGEGVAFRGALADVAARWSGQELESGGALSFEGDGAEMLAQISNLTRRGMRSNILSGLPTDCPTREKHGWLGDAADAAGGALYHWFAPTVYEVFLRQVADAQCGVAAGRSCPAAVPGFVPVVVPCHGGVDAASNDLSWTSGFVVASALLRERFGDGATVRRHWSALRAWTDGQVANASAYSSSGGLPDYRTYGDMAALARGSGHKGGWDADAGRQTASASYLIALDAMQQMAADETVSGGNNATDAARWAAQLTRLRALFGAQFWDASRSSFTNASNVSQTVDGLALAALNASMGAPRRKAVAAGLLADVASRNYSRTTGNVGSRLLLSTLSAMGKAGHDAALRVVLGRAYPSYGTLEACARTMQSAADLLS